MAEGIFATHESLRIELKEYIILRLSICEGYLSCWRLWRDDLIKKVSYSKNLI